MPDRVVLRRWPDSFEVIALFPDLAEHDGLITSYQHIGQHGAADYQYVISQTIPAMATASDSAALLTELRQIGYKPKVTRRVNAAQARTAP